MIWLAWGSEASWLSIIVRAESEQRARELALEKVREYVPDEREVGLSLLEPEGPDEILFVDDS